MMICPVCNAVIGWNSYCGAFVCCNCGYDSRDSVDVKCRKIDYDKCKENNKKDKE